MVGKTKNNLLRRAVCLLSCAAMLLRFSAAALAAPGYDASGQKLLALTFDDGPGPYTDDILNTLGAHGAKATFFMSGYRVEAYAAQVRRAAEEGHQIGNHTYSHTRLTKLGAAKLREEIDSSARLLAVAAGCGDGAVFYLRPPYGEQNEQVRAAANAPVVLWSVDTEDWRYQDAGRLVSYTADRAKDGDIVLMHEIQKSTAQGLGALLGALEAQGFEFVTVEELLWRRGVEPEAGRICHLVRNTGVERCARELWYDERRLAEHWAYDDICAALDGGLMERNGSGDFLPNFPLTRGAFVTALGRLLAGDAPPRGDVPFADVPADGAVARSTAWAMESGVMVGVSEDRFEPERPITRQELAVVLARCARLAGAEAADFSLDEYADRADISSWAQADVARCSALGLLRGSDGAFLPHAVATRAMGAAVLGRLSRLVSERQSGSAAE